MKSVSPYESRLLRLLEHILHPGGVTPTIKARWDMPRPSCLSRAAVELVQDRLGKGVVHLLARQGWRHERFLRGDQTRTGRLWERSDVADLPLMFSKHSLELLCRLAAQPVVLGDWDPAPSECTVADRLLLALTFRNLRSDSAGNLAKLEVWRRDGLCRLMFPDEVTEGDVELDWTPWTTGLGSCILEAWQSVLMQRWLDAEAVRGQIVQATKMQVMGNNMGRLLDSLLAALDRNGRWDLARFLLQFAGEVLARQPTAHAWIGKLNVAQMRLADRTQAYRAALASLGGLTKMQAWQQQARTIGYFEEGYAASQLWKSLWETHRGDDICAHAERIRREVEPMGM